LIKNVGDDWDVRMGAAAQRFSSIENIIYSVPFSQINLYRR